MSWNNIIDENRAEHQATLENESCDHCGKTLINCGDHWNLDGKKWLGCPDLIDLADEPSLQKGVDYIDQFGDES